MMLLGVRPTVVGACPETPGREPITGLTVGRGVPRGGDVRTPVGGSGATVGGIAMRFGVGSGVGVGVAGVGGIGACGVATAGP
jgi:hypothetical protein